MVRLNNWITSKSVTLMIRPSAAFPETEEIVNILNGDIAIIGFSISARTAKVIRDALHKTDLVKTVVKTALPDDGRLP
jgi:hypothetical protein